MASSITLVVGLVLLGLTAARIAAALRIGSPAAFLIGVFVIAHAELLLVALGLSTVRAFTPVWVMTTLAAITGVTLVLTRGRRSGIRWRVLVDTVRSDRVLIVLAVVAALGFAYSLAMGIWVPQVEDDVLTYHLVRAPLWRQHHGITYLHGIFDLRNNAYPPGGELGPFATMTLAGNDYFVALDQWLCAVALAIGSAGIARRIGFGARQALFGGLLVLTLPLIALQAGTAMSDLVVAAFLLSAVLFLLEGGKASPWLAGVATALAMGVKQSAPIGIPVLLVFAWLARPLTLRRARLLAVVAGAVIGAYWYAVNLVETHTWDGHVSDEFQVDRHALPVLSRISRIAILFIDLSGANGRDRWLYAIVAGFVLVLGAVFFLRRRDRALLITGAIAALVALVPLTLLPIEHRIIRAYFKFWDVVAGRRDLANLDGGRDITKAASNFSWYGPLGSVLLVGAGVAAVVAWRRGRLDRAVLVCVLAPAYWIVGFAVVLWYQDWIGRFFAFPIALTAATWGIVLQRRALAWGVTAVAATSLFLALANDAKRPSGLPLLEGNKPRSVWDTPRWTGVALRDDYDAPIRFLDQRIPDSAAVALAITPSDPVYPFFGRGLERRVTFVYPDNRDVPGARWVFVRPGRAESLCAAWKTALKTADGWRILHRSASATCA
jgi:4-amino-4-deoxy-L-arabinose transferase-like glycosyltransferase